MMDPVEKIEGCYRGIRYQKTNRGVWTFVDQVPGRPGDFWSGYVPITKRLNRMTDAEICKMIEQGIDNAYDKKRVI